MLDYEWGNPSTIILSGNEGGTATEPDQAHRQMFDHNYTLLDDHFLHGSIPTTTTVFSHHHFNPPQPQPHQHHTFFDPRTFPGASATSFSSSLSMFSLNLIPPVSASHCGLGPDYGLGLLLMPKSDNVTQPMDSGGSGLGLNLGRRTYFASCNDDIAKRLYRQSKTIESSNLPRCQAEGCNADLSDAKHYHRRHKVCEFHSKATTVIAAGLTQRFCQQCSRFHLLSEFDNGKRSCRKRLADHNRRRRKIQQSTQEIKKSQTILDNVTRSSPDSGAQSSPLAKVKVSRPDYFQKGAYRNRGSSSTSGSMFI